MTAATETGPRIAALDIVRGVAVMGILAMNIVAFAMPFEAYMNPLAYGNEGKADLLSWFFSFIFIDGKMRGLFSFLFGASILLVIQRAEAAGQPSEKVHFRRMLWLLLFGLIHFYFIWFGDILALYAPMGMLAWFFHSNSARALVRWGAGLVLLQFLIFAAISVSFHVASAAAAAPGASEEAIATWAELKSQFAAPSPEDLAKDLATYGGGYAGIVGQRFSEFGVMPLTSILMFGAETLGYMLLGMAGLKSGFLSGAWPAAAYRRAATIGYGMGVPVYAALGWVLWSSRFKPILVLDISMTATTLVRPAMVVGTAALVILATRHGGALTERIAAAGRAAFTNYLGTSILMTTFFYGYGFGLFGELTRVELWLVVLAMWALMLTWSKPWLERYRYGPLEWLWRTLARWEIQPMRRAIAG